MVKMYCGGIGRRVWVVEIGGRIDGETARRLAEGRYKVAGFDLCLPAALRLADRLPSGRLAV